jgi:hypothetical protein
MKYTRVALKNSPSPNVKGAVPSGPSSGLQISESMDYFDQETNRDTGEMIAGGIAKREWSLSRFNLEHREAPGNGLARTFRQPVDFATPASRVQREMPENTTTSNGQNGELSGMVSLSQAASNLEQAQRNREERTLRNGPVQFRVPTTADMKALFSSGNVPEDVLKNRAQIALSRMAREKKLKTPDSVADIMKKVFRAAGVFNEAAYEAAVDVSNRQRVYQSVLDAEAKVTSADKPKLKTTMEEAAKLIDDCVADNKNLASVFGSKKDTAKNVFKKAKAALVTAANHIDSNVSTDYNLDDPETSLGEWAIYASQRVYFEASVTQVKDEPEAKITMIHEASHLADPSVKDKGYYGTSGFEGMPEDKKVTNAAHYEEIPRRKLSKSDFTDSSGNFIDFKPGMSAAGAKQTLEQQAKKKASDYFMKAWDKAVDVHELIRDIRIEKLAGSTATFTAKKARVLEIFKLMHLTVHEQPAATASVNQIDVVSAEGVAHAMARLTDIVENQHVPNAFQSQTPPLSVGFKPQRANVLEKQLELKPIPGLSVGPELWIVDSAAGKVIEDSMLAMGSLVGSHDDDKKLVDWLAAEYKKDL